MKTIGLLGGMSWLSTIPYYRIINETVSAELGGMHSAKVLLASVDFHELEQCQQAGRWDAAGDMLADAAIRLERGGADFLVICSNTMHKVVARIVANVRLPLLHIADAAAEAIAAAKLTRVGLLGTRFTMEEPFYKDRLAARHGIEVSIPPPVARTFVHRSIYDELCHGQLRAATRKRFAEIAAALIDDGAEGIVLGCTEIGLLLEPDDVAVPLFETATIHARAAARQALPGRAIEA